MIVLKILLVVLAGFILLHQVVARVVRKFVHFPAPAFISRVLDSKFRRRIQPPDKLIERSGLAAGMHVLDLGCGSGAVTVPMARLVAPDGKVYALDIQPAMLARLDSKLGKPENSDVANIELMLGSAHDLPFADNSLDAVCMTTVLQEIPDPDRTLQEIKRVLRGSGILAVTELFPDPDYPFTSTTIKMGRRAGFTLDEASGNLWNYTVRFSKPPDDR